MIANMSEDLTARELNKPHQSTYAISRRGSAATGIDDSGYCVITVRGNDTAIKTGAAAIVRISHAFYLPNDDSDPYWELYDQTARPTHLVGAAKFGEEIGIVIEKALEFPDYDLAPVDSVQLDEFPPFKSLGKFVGKLRSVEKLELHPELFD